MRKVNIKDFKNTIDKKSFLDNIKKHYPDKYEEIKEKLEKDIKEGKILEYKSCSNCRYSNFGKTDCFRLSEYANPKINRTKGIECGENKIHWRGQD